MSPLKEGDSDYIKDPSPNDKVHCLVSVVPADTVSQMENAIFEKMKYVRKAAVQLGELLKDVI